MSNEMRSNDYAVFEMLLLVNACHTTLLFFFRISLTAAQSSRLYMRFFKLFFVARLANEVFTTVPFFQQLNWWRRQWGSVERGRRRRCKKFHRNDLTRKIIQKEGNKGTDLLFKASEHPFKLTHTCIQSVECKATKHRSFNVYRLWVDFMLLWLYYFVGVSFCRNLSSVQCFHFVCSSKCMRTQYCCQLGALLHDPIVAIFVLTRPSSSPYFFRSQSHYSLRRNPFSWQCLHRVNAKAIITV